MKQFVNPPEQYGRDLDIVGTYHKDAAKYLSLQSGKSVEECLAFVKYETSAKGSMPIQIPDALILVRDKKGDRHQQTVPFNEFIEATLREEGILSPSMTGYVNPAEKESLLGMYVSNNLALRKAYKHKSFDAKMKGDMVSFAIFDGLQNSSKIKNNALSGAHCSPYTILFNKSSHSSLTSACRAATSYGNANNEKFLYGNRHYWSPDLVQANVVSIINHTDMAKFAATMAEFGIRAPTVDETMECITYSTDVYWRNANEVGTIRSLISALSDVQRAAFVYTSDMYHLAKYNPEMVRTLLGKLSAKATVPVDDPDVWMARADDNLRAFVGLLCAKELDGLTINDAKEKTPEAYAIIAATVKNIVLTIESYEQFIRAFWVTENLPTSIASLPAIIRRGAITSDTDSTIFTVQYWTEWYVGRLDFSETSNAIAATTVYLASQLIRHVLAKLSSNMGVVKSQLHKLSMKNEFMFPVFSLTTRAKHYFAYISAREGNVFKVYDTEIKGVALRSSNAPPELMRKAKAMMLACMDTVIAGEKISYRKILSEVAEIENGIRASIEAGKYDLMSRTSIKGPESYKDANSSNYIHYEMWEDVFANKYGHTPPPPYSAIKVSVDAPNPTKLKEWIANMGDPAISANFEAWIAKRGRKDVTMLLVPEAVVSSSGIPKELVRGVNIRELIAGVMEAFYLILESLGIYMKNRNLTRLASDTDWNSVSPGVFGELTEERGPEMPVIQEMINHQEPVVTPEPVELVNILLTNQSDAKDNGVYAVEEAALGEIKEFSEVEIYHPNNAIDVMDDAEAKAEEQLNLSEDCVPPEDPVLAMQLASLNEQIVIAAREGRYGDIPDYLMMISEIKGL